MKQKTGRKLLSFLLTLAMVIGLVPGMGLTAYAESESAAETLKPTVNEGKVTNAKKLWFARKYWYVIASGNTGVQLATGAVSKEDGQTTLVLLAVESEDWDDVKFSENGSLNYSTSVLKATIDGVNIENSLIGNDSWMKNLIAKRSLTGGASSGEGWRTEDNICGDTVTGATLWPLSANEASQVDNSILKYGDNNRDWWLRSPGSETDGPACVWNGNVSTFMYTNELYVRPALCLNLTNDISASGTNVYGYGQIYSLSINYPLQVGGVQVTSANASNIDGNNKASYNAETKTLTLNGYSYKETISYDINGSGGIKWTGTDELKIELKGTNSLSLTSSDYNQYGIWATNGAIVISGDGTLDARARNNAIMAPSLTINSGTITATSVNGRSAGIVASQVAINGGELTATGGNYDPAISGNVTNAITGTGWTNVEGTEGKADIAVSSTGQTLTYRKVQFPPAPPPHTHTVDGNPVTLLAWTDELAATQNGEGKTAANSLPKTQGSYYLTKDVTLSSTWTVPTGATNLCLSGKTIHVSEGGYGIEIVKNAQTGLSAILNLFDEAGGSGKITGGKSSYWCVNVGYNCQFNMSGGSITGNEKGVYVNGAFHMSGGTITGNTGDGVTLQRDGSFTVSGSPVITKNGDNVWISDGEKITVAGVLGENAKIGVTMSPGVFTSGWGTYMSGQEADSCFTSDISGYFVMKEGDELKLSSHEHSFTYSVSGSTITAACGNTTGCPLEKSGYKATLTIAAPTLTTYGQTGEGISAAAVITDANGIQGGATVSYYAATKSGTTYTKGDKLESAPTAAGDYVAEITVGGKTAFVGYTISKTAQAAPTGFKSTPVETPYANGSIDDGKTAIDKTNLQVSTDGGKTWADVTQFPVSGKPGVYQFKYKETDALSESPVTSVLLEATNELREVKITSDKTDANIYKSGETNTLTAKTNTNVEGLTLEFAWYREGVTEAVGTDESYTLQAADVGKKLTVVVTDKTTDAPTNPAPTVSTATPVIVTVAPTTYQITGNVKVPTTDGGSEYDNVASANVELRQGNTVFATAKASTDGNYTFDRVPNGEYNIVVTDANGTTKTEYGKVENGNQTINVTMPFYKVSSKVDVKGETPAAVVAGLDDAAADSLTTDEKTSGVTTTMTMEIESTDDLTAKEESQLTDEQKQVKTEQQAIKAQNNGASKSDTLDFIDMSVYKRTQKTGESAQVEDIHNLSKVLEILLPYTTANRSFNIFRYHGTAATKFTRLTTRPTGSFTDGRFFVGDGFIAIYASGFSTYAIGYSASSSSDPAPVPATTPAYNSGDSSSDSDDYINRVVKSDNGTVSVNRDTASNGEKVTITIKPNAGYAADTVTVSGSGNRNVAVTKVTDTTYTYIQPGTDVKINVTFKPVSGTAEANCPLSAFTDADAKAWYHDGVHWALENGVMNGVGGGKFNPGGETSRAMVVTMLWRLEGSPAYVGKNEFDDVKSEDWYAQAVRWASAEGIVTGYEQDGVKVFNPNGAVTREQLATMLYRYAQHKGQGFTGLWSFPLDYPDASSVSEWAYEAMCWMTMNGVINGMDGKLVPAASATRAQVASMFMRYCTSAAK